MFLTTLCFPLIAFQENISSKGSIWLYRDNWNSFQIKENHNLADKSRVQNPCLHSVKLLLGSACPQDAIPSLISIVPKVLQSVASLQAMPRERGWEDIVFHFFLFQEVGCKYQAGYAPSHPFPSNVFPYFWSLTAYHWSLRLLYSQNRNL